ncbi:MAG: hypothetical protein IPH07_38450 [Deltaproteobacteria bacterium]|nr:hypothetical protein [Deltaproteobacteria bacterium]MBK8713709.1 hypothetical protein [Deltaproteobacteria bacterium]
MSQPRRFLACVAVAAAAVLACERGPDASTCFDACGEGTRCDGGKCVVVAAAAEPAAVAPEAKRSGRRGRRRPRAGGEGSGDDGDASDATATYVPVDDRRIPKYDATATTVLDPAAGSERLDDATVRSHLRKLEPALDRCITDAATAGVSIGSGRVKFVFGLSPSGKVTGVTAKAPPAIRDAGIVPCLRQVVFEHRFPSYDGPPMGVDYSFEVG